MPSPIACKEIIREVYPRYIHTYVRKRRLRRAKTKETEWRKRSKRKKEGKKERETKQKRPCAQGAGQKTRGKNIAVCCFDQSHYMPCRWANRTTTPKDQTDDKTRGRAEAGTELFNIEKPGQKVGAPLSQHVSRATGGRGGEYFRPWVFGPLHEKNLRKLRKLVIQRKTQRVFFRRKRKNITFHNHILVGTCSWIRKN